MTDRNVRSYSPFAHLAKAVLPPCLPYEDQLAVLHAGHEWWTDHPRWSVMIHMAYGDVSGNEESGVLTAACYLGKEDEWMNAIAAWAAALKDAGVDVFRATDFFNTHGAFDDDRWRRKHPTRNEMIPGSDLHVAFAKRFTTIPVNHGLIGFAFSLDLAAFTTILAPELARTVRQYPEGEPRTYAIMSALTAVGNFLEKSHYQDQASIQAIFEREKGAGKFVTFFDESKERRERFTYWFKSFTVVGKEFLPVQMGDLLAHEAWRRTKQVWADETAAPRKSFQAMLGDGRVVLNVLDREHCERNAIQVRDILDRFPDGLVPAEYTRPV